MNQGNIRVCTTDNNWDVEITKGDRGIGLSKKISLKPATESQALESKLGKKGKPKLQHLVILLLSLITKGSIWVTALQIQFQVFSSMRAVLHSNL